MTKISPSKKAISRFMKDTEFTLEDATIIWAMIYKYKIENFDLLSQYWDEERRADNSKYEKARKIIESIKDAK